MDKNMLTFLSSFSLDLDVNYSNATFQTKEEDTNFMSYKTYG